MYYLYSLCVCTTCTNSYLFLVMFCLYSAQPLLGVCTACKVYNLSLVYVLTCTTSPWCMYWPVQPLLGVCTACTVYNLSLVYVLTVQCTTSLWYMFCLYSLQPLLGVCTDLYSLSLVNVLFVQWTTSPWCMYWPVQCTTSLWCIYGTVQPFLGVCNRTTCTTSPLWISTCTLLDVCTDLYSLSLMVVYLYSPRCMYWPVQPLLGVYWMIVLSWDVPSPSKLYHSLELQMIIMLLEEADIEKKGYMIIIWKLWFENTNVYVHMYRCVMGRIVIFRSLLFSKGIWFLWFDYFMFLYTYIVHIPSVSSCY